METTLKITLKHWIRENPVLAEQLKRNSSTLDQTIKELSTKTNINEVFLIQNIDQIRNWI